MKSKCSFILKASTALVLALLMLFGTVATSVAAVVENTAASSDKAADEAVEDAAVETTEEPAADIAEEEMSGEAIETVFDKLKKQCGELKTAESEAEAPAPERKNNDLTDTGATGDWYIVGNVAGANNWSERDAVKLSAVTGGYSISIRLEKDKDFRLRHNDADYGANSSSDSDRKVSNGNSYTVKQGNQTFIWNGETGTYTVTVNSAGTSITFGSGGSGTAETWTVAGSSASIFGTAWAPSATANDMTLTDTNTYTKSFTNVTDTSNFEFKIAKDNAWTTAYPSNNFKVTHVDTTTTRSIAATTEESGNLYWKSGDTITFTFNSSDHKISITSETPEITHDVTFTAGAGGTISPSGTVAVGVSTATTITATPAAGYQFSSWTFGNGISGGNTTANPTDITTGGSGSTYTVQANFTKKNLTVSKTEEHGTFTISKTSAQVGDTITVSNITAAKGYQLASSNKVQYTYNGTTAYATASGSNFTFTMPGYDTTVKVNFTAKTGNTITRTATPSEGGTVYVGTVQNTAATSSTYLSYTTGDTRYVRAAANAAYTLSKIIVTYANGDVVEETTNNYVQLNTDGSKFSNDNDGSISVEAIFTLKPLHTITVKSSNNIYGTASATVTEAYEGQSVTLTAAENTGTFSKWKVTSGTVSGVDNQTAKSKSFTMGSTDLVITANFAAYTGTSNFYYNSYETSGSPSSSRYGAQMTEAKLGGETYSYYHVTGRTGADQLFTVSYGSPKYNSWDCFFDIEWTGTPKALFYATDGQNLGDWSDMTYKYDENGKKKFAHGIPDGARSVRFKHGSNETAELFFSSGNNGWYTNGSMSSLTGYSSSNPVPLNFYENFNGENKYTTACGSGGFYAYNANRGQSHAYSVPNNMDESQRGDYYILVLYENKTYTINGIEHKADKNPEIIWLPTLPDETTDLAHIYAKDGCINVDRKSTRVIGTTNISASDTVKNVRRSQISGNTVYAEASAEKGKSITITTTINSAYASKYIVKGWDVNGDTYCLDPVATGNTYTATFTVPDAKKVEITPIYWLKSTYNTTTFFVKDFNKAPKEWGNALYYYYWGGSQVDVENEEKYPGQPFVHAGGQYYAQVPSDVTGVTLNNAVWDTVHAELIMGLDSADSAKQAAHYQTYDYDNFAKIKEEVSNINSIYFTFKYESKKDNLNSTSPSSGTITLSQYNDTNGNGWEDYKDTLGRDLNIFGGTDVSGSGKLYVVSNGYARNYQGKFATEWSIYYTSAANPTSASFVGTIPSSALILNEATDFSKTKYVTDYTPALTSYQTTWQTLKNTYSTVPVSITYEKALRYGNSQIHTVSGDTTNDPADRVDGKWDYTKNDDFVTADIKIQLSDDNGATYTDDTFTSDSSNEGPTTQAQAYFNNEGAGYANKHKVVIDDGVVVSTTETFKLKTIPKASTGYQFVGWYRLDDGSANPELITTLTDAESLKSSKATFIARYKLVTAGNLVINHDADGAGSSTKHTVKVEIYDSEDQLVNTFEDESVTIDDTYITSSSSYKIKVTLTAQAAANSYIANDNAASNPVPSVVCSQTASTFYKTPAYTRNVRFANSKYPVDIVTAVSIFNVSALYTGSTQNVKVLTYTTTFNKLPTYTINYKYHGRGQSGSDYLTFTRAITLSPDEAEGKTAAGATYSGNEGNALTATYKTTSGDGLVNDITANAPNANDLNTEVFNKVIAWSVPSTVTANTLDVIATESDPDYTLTYSYVDINGDTVTNKTVTKKYNTLITLDGNNSTFATAPTQNGVKFAYWADESGNPLTTTREYKMRLVDNVTIHPVYNTISAGWNSAIEKITRTHETSDSSDYVYTDLALRFTGFDDSGAFIHINPDHNDRYRVGVALVYDTAGNNTTNTTIEGDTALYTFPSSGYSYTDAQSMIQLLVSRSLTTARLSGISATTYVTMNDADNTKLTNFNRMDYAVKYNYNTYYKRSYDAYAYVIDKTDNSVLAVSPVKSGYIFDGTLPVGN